MYCNPEYKFVNSKSDEAKKYLVSLKSRIKHLLFAAIFLLIQQSCEKNNLTHDVSCDIPTNEKIASKFLIIGNWNWVSELYWSQREGRLILLTPETEGYTRKLIVNSREFEFRKDNMIESKFLYDFIQESEVTTINTDSSTVLVFKNINTGAYSNYVHFRICNDTLTLNFQVRSDFKGQEKWARR